MYASYQTWEWPIGFKKTVIELSMAYTSLKGVLRNLLTLLSNGLCEQ